MGCDMHWYSETKKDGEWFCDQADSFTILVDEDSYPEMQDFPNRGRDYWFFGFLQPGVRTQWDWSFPERMEVPSDLSMEVQAKFDYWQDDAHSGGYFTRAELKAKQLSLKEYQVLHLIAPTHETAALNHHVKSLEEVISNLAADVPDTDQRIVFWFDN